MLDGRPLIDVHLHAARLPTLKPSWTQWAHDFGDRKVLDRVYDGAGTMVAAEFDAYLAGEGVDTALVLAEYSPKATGIQPVEDLLPLTAYNPDRIKIIANINPHLHYPVDEELERQIGLGAVALKIHPVHAGAAVNDRALYPAYEICQSAGLLQSWCTAGPARSPDPATRWPTRSCSMTSSVTSGVSTSCSPTAAVAGGMTRPRSWPWSIPTSGSSCPGCRPRGCASTTPGTAGRGLPGR